MWGKFFVQRMAQYKTQVHKLNQFDILLDLHSSKLKCFIVNRVSFKHNRSISPVDMYQERSTKPTSSRADVQLLTYRTQFGSQALSS